MDVYIRYMLRASGERKHQGQNRGEAAVFALLDKGKEDSRFLPRGWEDMDANERSRWITDAAACIKDAVR